MNHVVSSSKSIKCLFRPKCGLIVNPQRNNHFNIALKLFKDEPVYGASPMVVPGSHRQSPFRFLMKYVNIGRYYMNYDKSFNAEEFLAGSRFVFLKLSDIIRRKALDELESFVPGRFSEKLCSAVTTLNDSDRTYLFDFKEKDVTNYRVYECDFQKDPSNQKEFFHVVVCFDVMLNIEDVSPFELMGKLFSQQNRMKQQPEAPRNAKPMDTMEDFYKAGAEMVKNIISASLIFSKQVRPTVDEDWTLSSANYARVKV